MDVSSETKHTVLSAGLLVAGGVFLAASVIEVILVMMTRGLGGMGNPTAEEQQQSAAMSEQAMLFAGGVGLIGLTLFVAGILWWPRRRLGRDVLPKAQ